MIHDFHESWFQAHQRRGFVRVGTPNKLRTPNPAKKRCKLAEHKNCENLNFWNSKLLFFLIQAVRSVEVWGWAARTGAPGGPAAEEKGSGAAKQTQKTGAFWNSSVIELWLNCLNFGRFPIAKILANSANSCSKFEFSSSQFERDFAEANRAFQRLPKTLRQPEERRGWKHACHVKNLNELWKFLPRIRNQHSSQRSSSRMLPETQTGFLRVQTSFYMGKLLRISSSDVCGALQVKFALDRRTL